MAFNGTGTFTRLYNWVTDQASGIFVRADRMDADADDIALGLSNCITRDGQSAATANIPLGGFKLTGVGTGAALTDAVNFGQVFNSPTFSSPTGTGVVTFSGATSVLVPTVATSDNSTNAASTAYVTQKAFATALPAQVADYFLTSNGTVASFGNTLKATVIRLKDGTDATKLLAFDLSGITTATTRTVTIPNKSGTLAMTSDITYALLATLTPTGTANADFLTTASASYDAYVIETENLLPSVTDALLMRIAVAGVSDTATNYFVGTTGTTSISIGGSVLGGGKGQSGTIKVLNANDAVGLKHVSYNGSRHVNATPNYTQDSSGAAYVATNAVSGFRLYWSAGATFAGAGKIYVYGIRIN